MNASGRERVHVCKRMSMYAMYMRARMRLCELRARLCECVYLT